MIENVNGIQVDISKYVGEEIAKFAVASIPEERLLDLARKAIVDLNTSYWSGGERITPIHKMTAELLSKKIQEHIVEIIEQESFKEEARKQAELIIEEMQKKVREIVIEQYANALAGNISTGYFGGMFTMNVEEIVMKMMSNR